MKYYIIGFMMLLAVSMPVSAQTATSNGHSAGTSFVYEKTPVKDFLKTMPDTILPILSKNNILDFIDFMESGQQAEVTNKMHGKSIMMVLENDFASIALTTHTRADIKLLPKGNDDVLIYVVTTTRTDSLYDSHVKVYNENWTLAPEPYQFEILHPERFTELVMQARNSTMGICETMPQLLFEGEKPSDHPTMKNECILLWNKDKGMFERGLYEEF